MNCDTDTFARMYEMVYTDLYRLALCMMQNQQEAEDAVSEAVVAAYGNIRKLRDPQAFKNWMFTILSNICRRKLKKAKKQMSYVTEEIYSQSWLQEPDYGTALDVRRAFFILEKEEREIVGLSVFGGYTSKEIAHVLHMNPNTVRSKRRRALKKMECLLK